MAAKKAARTRARRLEEKYIAESIAASSRAVASKKGAKVRRRRRASREKRGVLEAKVIAAGKRATATYETLVSALERMARSSGLELEVRGNLGEGKTLWLVVGAFIPRTFVTYQRLQEIFARWENDFTLEATINPRRVAWIRWDVEALARKRGRDGSGYAPARIGEWGRVISEAQQGADSLSEIYAPNDRGDGKITEVQVYFGAQVISGQVVRL